MTLPKYYTSLFNAVTVAIEEIDNQNYGNARKILMKAQLKAEGFVIDEEAYADEDGSDHTK